jgi:Ca2+-binding RTX toxin-like protein
MPLTLIFTQPGTFTIDDNGIPGDNTSVIRDGNGTVIFTFLHPADALTFRVSTPGVNLIVNFTDSLNAADFTIGSLDPDPLIGPAQTPDSIVMHNIRTTGNVTLVSNGSIVEGGNDAAADIVAGSLVMSAQTGVGTIGNAIETQTGLLEAETVTGGINMRNTGSVQIGGLNDFVNGLDVLTSGDLTLTTVGSIFLSEIDLDPGNPPPSALETIHGGNVSGNVNLTANGFSSDIIANTDIDAITAPRGSITLIAGRDVAFGTVGTDFDNDVRANGNVTIHAGRDFLIDGFSDLASDDFGQSTGGDVIINTGRNVHLRNVAGTDASVSASGSVGGNVLITTGFGGALILDAPTPTALSANSGDITVSADRVLISASSGINAGAGQVTLRPATEGREMILGSASDAALAVELSDSELNRIFATSLTLGSTETGRVSVIAPIAPISAGNAPDLIIRSGSEILVGSNITTIDALTLRGGTNVFQTAASVITAGNVTPGIFTALIDDVQDDSNDGGIGSLLGTIVGSSVRINGNLHADTLEGTDGNDLLSGNGGNDKLRGRGGADVLDGGIGADQMTGGLGDDEFIVDNAGDVVIEGVGEGSDTVKSSISLTLAANVDNLTLTGSSNLNGTGNGLANTLLGNAGNNILDGKADADTMKGGTGNDTYKVDNSGDIVTEFAGQGTDIVQASATFTIANNIENLTLTGVGNIDGTGNGLVNTLLGNTGNNILDGKAGADTMKGGTGDDTYVVDNLGDIVTEFAGQGTDIVQAGVTFTIGNHVENLTLTGVANINGTGNGLANTLLGNTGNNILSGLGGNDQIGGGTGIDFIFGGAGNDDLTGGTGADRFQFDAALSAATNVDDILDFSVADDTIFLDRDIFTGLAANGALPASIFVNGTAAGDANDRIIYDSATGNIFYDANGNVAGAQILFATVAAGTALTNADFFAYI